MSAESSPKLTVLVADDLSMVRRPICIILARRGFRTIEAADGAAAIEILSRERIDAVLLDLSMPVVDGFTVLERVRQLPAAPPVIVFTGQPLRATVERALALGAAEVVIKGTETIAGLLDRIRAAIAARAGQSSPAPP